MLVLSSAVLMCYAGLALQHTGQPRDTQDYSIAEILGQNRQSWETFKFRRRRRSLLTPNFHQVMFSGRTHLWQSLKHQTFHGRHRTPEKGPVVFREVPFQIDGDHKKHTFRNREQSPKAYIMSSINTSYSSKHNNGGGDKHRSANIINEDNMTTSDEANRIKRTIIGRHPVCPLGCTSCSDVNGCVTCERRYFMFLYRYKMRQIGMCVPSCPSGHFIVSHQEYNECFSCLVPKCLVCSRRRHCTRCYTGFMAHRGRCLKQCAVGLYFANYSGVCREKVDCLVGAWSTWSTCKPRRRDCGRRRGVKVRKREVLESPSPNGAECPSLKERRGCPRPRSCQGKECRNRKRNKRKQKRTWRRKWKKGRRRGQGRAQRKKYLMKKRRQCRSRFTTSRKCRPGKLCKM